MELNHEVVLRNGGLRITKFESDDHIKYVSINAIYRDNDDQINTISINFNINSNNDILCKIKCKNDNLSNISIYSSDHNYILFPLINEYVIYLKKWITENTNWKIESDL